MSVFALLALLAVLASVAVLTALRLAGSRRRAVAALFEAEQKFTRIFQSCPDAMQLIGLEDARCRDLNPSAGALFGYSRAEALGRSVLPGGLALWVNPEDRTRFLAILEAQGEVDGFAALLRRKDGSTFTALISASILVLGGERSVLSTTRDSARQRVPGADRRHSGKLESLGRLTSGMAHDMSNILAGILGAAEMLKQRFPADEALGQGLDSILHAGSRGRDLVRALTEFARKGERESQPFDLNGLLAKEAELLRHAAPQGIRLMLDLDPELPLVVGDASDLGGTIMNLGFNALDAMPRGGTLRFRSRALACGEIELVVTDSGEGMAPEVLARAEEPFFTTKPPGLGTGLGLARVHATVKAHGGTLAIQSRPAHGTSVTLRLPGYSAAEDEPETADSRICLEEIPG